MYLLHQWRDWTGQWPDEGTFRHHSQWWLQQPLLLLIISFFWVCKQNQRQAGNPTGSPEMQTNDLEHESQIEKYGPSLDGRRENLSHRNSICIWMHSYRCCVCKDCPFLRLEVGHIFIKLNFTRNRMSKWICSIFRGRTMKVGKKSCDPSWYRLLWFIRPWSWWDAARYKNAVHSSHKEKGGGKVGCINASNTAFPMGWENDHSKGVMCHTLVGNLMNLRGLYQREASALEQNKEQYQHIGEKVLLIHNK